MIVSIGTSVKERLLFGGGSARVESPKVGCAWYYGKQRNVKVEPMSK
jgi:hypothetical protein